MELTARIHIEEGSYRDLRHLIALVGIDEGEAPFDVHESDAERTG